MFIINGVQSFKVGKGLHFLELCKGSKSITLILHAPTDQSKSGVQLNLWAERELDKSTLKVAIAQRKMLDKEVVSSKSNCCI